MTKNEIFKLISENPVFYLATIDNEQPRVRAMLLYRADENGIIFHTAATKDVYTQLINNPQTEICFSCGEVQVRITGTSEHLDNDTLKHEIFEHPTRKFLKLWQANGVDLDKTVQVFCMKNCSAVTWTMADNFKPKTYIDLC